MSLPLRLAAAPQTDLDQPINFGAAIFTPFDGFTEDEFKSFETFGATTNKVIKSTTALRQKDGPEQRADENARPGSAGGIRATSPARFVLGSAKSKGQNASTPKHAAEKNAIPPMAVGAFVSVSKSIASPTIAATSTSTAAKLPATKSPETSKQRPQNRPTTPPHPLTTTINNVTIQHAAVRRQMVHLATIRRDAILSEAREAICLIDEYEAYEAVQAERDRKEKQEIEMTRMQKERQENDREREERRAREGASGRESWTGHLDGGLDRHRERSARLNSRESSLERDISFERWRRNRDRGRERERSRSRGRSRSRSPRRGRRGYDSRVRSRSPDSWGRSSDLDRGKKYRERSLDRRRDSSRDRSRKLSRERRRFREGSGVRGLSKQRRRQARGRERSYERRRDRIRRNARGHGPRERDSILRKRTLSPKHAVKTTELSTSNTTPTKNLSPSKHISTLSKPSSTWANGSVLGSKEAERALLERLLAPVVEGKNYEVDYDMITRENNKALARAALKEQEEDRFRAVQEKITAEVNKVQVQTQLNEQQGLGTKTSTPATGATTRAIAFKLPAKPALKTLAKAAAEIPAKPILPPTAPRSMREEVKRRKSMDLNFSLDNRSRISSIGPSQREDTPPEPKPEQPKDTREEVIARMHRRLNALVRHAATEMNNYNERAGAVIAHYEGAIEKDKSAKMNERQRTDLEKAIEQVQIKAQTQDTNIVGAEKTSKAAPNKKMDSKADDDWERALEEMMELELGKTGGNNVDVARDPRVKY